MGACWSYKIKTETPSNTCSILESSNLKNFNFNELKIATRNFRPNGVPGEDGFGSVFKGWIDKQTLAPTKPGSGMIITVKRLINRPGGFSGHIEWVAQMNFLGKLRHPNLVKLIGFCLEDEHCFLVYEFMSGGCLENPLFMRGPYSEPLSWKLRMKIALDAAKGLAFLHNAELMVIYLEFKTSNILLDSSYNAKLSDFGQASDEPTVLTYGYAAPEYLATGHLTTKSNVYNFGVVLLELLSGRHAMDKNEPLRKRNLVDWAKPYLTSKRQILHVMDTRLEGKYSKDQAQKVANLALQCIRRKARDRPTMEEIVTSLEQIQSKHNSRGNLMRLWTCVAKDN